MAVLRDLIDTLQEWSRWKEIDATPERVAALERRVSDLEVQIGKRPKGEICPQCQSGRLEVTAITRSADDDPRGLQRHTLTCTDPECDYTETRQVDPSR